MHREKLTGLIIGVVILSSMLILNINIFFEKTAVTAKLLVVGSSMLLLFLLIPGWSQILKAIKQDQF